MSASKSLITAHEDTYKDGIVILKELLSEDKVQATFSTSVADKTVVGTGNTTPVGNLSLRQNVLARSEGKLSTTNGEDNVLEARIAASGNNNQSSSRVGVVAFDVLVQSVEGASLEVDESGSSINDTRKAAAGNGGSTVGNLGDIDAPVFLNQFY